MSAASDKVRVLLVEDTIDDALQMRAFFASVTGFAITHSQDGDRALDLLREREWDLVITDLNLPGTDGWDVIRTARALHRHLPILATTGYTQEHYWDQAFRAGADQVLVKPLDRDEFIARVRAMIRGRGASEGGGKESILVVDGLVGDGAMGCGGTLMQSLEEGARAVILPLAVDEALATPSELEASRLSSQILGVELRVAEALLAEPTEKIRLIERALEEIRPTTLYVPALDDTHPARMEASRLAVRAAAGVERIFGYQTGTTGTKFEPTRFVDISARMVLKMEAIAVFQSLGTGRADMRPRLAQTYAQYWGRFQEYSEVEAFEVIPGSQL